MSAESVIRVRVDKKLKRQATDVLRDMGLTPSDAFRIMMTRIAAEKKLPFELLVPNATTIAAMKEARTGKLKSYVNVQAMLADLDEQD